MSATEDQFTREAAGLPQVRATEVVRLSDGDTFELELAPVRKRIGDAEVRMLAYNGSIPGPTLRVPEGAEVAVNAVNHGDVDLVVYAYGYPPEETNAELLDPAV